MFSQTIRYVVFFLIGIANLFLVLGVLLIQAASVTGAESNYNIHVSWSSALRSVIWAPSWRELVLLLGILVLVIFTSFIFLRAPRSIGVSVLLLQAGIAFFFGGGLGLFFILREFETYHFSMDAEKLGEHWFIYEAVAAWALASAVLAFIRVFARKPVPNTQGH